MFGADHVETARARCSLGNAFLYASRFTKARMETQRALSVLERDLPDDHADIAEAIHLIGLTFASQKMHSKAESHMTKALRMRLDKLGDNHILVGYSYNDLGNLAQETNRFAALLARKQGN